MVSSSKIWLIVTALPCMKRVLMITGTGTLIALESSLTEIGFE